VELCRKHGLYKLPADANFVHDGASTIAVLLWDMDSEMSCIFQESPSYHCDFWDCTSCFWMVIVSLGVPVSKFELHCAGTRDFKCTVLCADSWIL